MATTKLEFSIRLHHNTESLSSITRQLGFVADVAWNVGEQNKTIKGVLQDGTRDYSYASFPLGAGTSNDLDDAFAECLGKLSPLSGALQLFVSSGGIASLVVAWYCDSDMSGDRIPLEVIAEMGRLRLALDLHIYLLSE